MSVKHESEKDHIFDDRRVSFSLPHTKKLNMAEKKLQDSDSIDAVDDAIDDAIDDVVAVKPKKKWKIKLPWKQKKQPIYHEYENCDDVSDKISDSETEECSKKKGDDDSDVDKALVKEKSPSSSPQKTDRPTTWHEGFRSDETSSSLRLDSRTKSTEIPKAQPSLKTDLDSSLASPKEEKRFDDVDFIPASNSLNKRNKSKGKKLRLNIYAFSKPSHTYGNQLKSPEGGDREMSPSEASSISDITKIPSPDNHRNKSNPASIYTDINEKRMIDTPDKTSSPKLDNYVTRVVPPYKKSSSLPSFFKKNKKRKEFDFKSPPPVKEYSSNIQTISSYYQEQHRNDKTASDSELQHNKTFMHEPSGLHSSIQRKKRRSNRSVFKMSRSSFIANSSTSKSLDHLNRNAGPEDVSLQESTLNKNAVKDFKSLHDIDVQSKSNSTFQKRPNSGRYKKDKKNFQKNDSYDLSSSDESSKDTRFDQKFKSDYALKLQQISSAPKSRKNKSPSPSNSNEEPEQRNKLEKKTDDQSVKMDEFTKFIKSYSSSKSAKITVGAQRKTNRIFTRSTEELEQEEKEVHSNGKNQRNLSESSKKLELKKEELPSNENVTAQIFSVVGDVVKHQKTAVSDVRDKNVRDKVTKNNSDMSSSDVGTLEHRDKELKSRTKKISESSTEKNDFTDFLQHYNSSKHSILKSSLKRETQKTETVEPLNNTTNIDALKPVEKQQIKRNSAEPRYNTKELHHAKESYKPASLEPTVRTHSSRSEKLGNKENIPSKFTDTGTGKDKKSSPIFEKMNSNQSTHNSHYEETVSPIRVRRRSYEEMTSLIEEQMFDSESNTDNDQVDLSFGRKIDSNTTKDDDFKLCVVTEKGTFSGTELVYEPKILPKKEENLPILKSIAGNELLKRPNEAPPIPPNSFDISHKSDRNAPGPQNILGKGENENMKRKKLRKTQRRRSTSHSSDSDTSIEDVNGTLYEKYSSKISGNEDNHKSLHQRSMPTKIDHIDSFDHLDCDSPPAFPPPVPPTPPPPPPPLPSPDSKEEILTHTNYKENIVDINHQPTNKLASTSANSVARNLYVHRETRNNLLKSNIPNFTVKNSKPIPESKPASLSTFSASYNPKNFTPKYEYAPNLPSVPPSTNSKRQPITCYSPTVDDDLGAKTEKLNTDDIYRTNENVEKTAHHSFQNQDPNPNFRYVQNQFSSNMTTESQFYHEKSNVENPMVQNPSIAVNVLEDLSAKPILESNNSYMGQYSRYSSVPAMNSASEFEASKKHFVTFDLPQHEKYMGSVPSYNLQYRDISMYEEKNNQQSVSRHDNSSYRPWPNNIYPYRLNSNTIPKSSSIVLEQVRSAQQDMIHAPDQREERYKHIDVSNENHLHQVYHSSTYPRDTDRTHNRYIDVSSPIPYSKQEKQLKSILKSNFKREDRTGIEPIQPSLVQTNVKYIQPVIGEVRSDFIRAPTKQLIPPPAVNSSAYNANIERVEITEDSSNSESEHPPPTPPSYPPPHPRQTWHHQQQKFLGGLLHTESNPNTSFYSQQTPDSSSYYTPTIIEVEAYRGEPIERESVYQNVIHASQV